MCVCVLCCVSRGAERSGLGCAFLGERGGAGGVVDCRPSFMFLLLLPSVFGRG